MLKRSIIVLGFGLAILLMESRGSAATVGPVARSTVAGGNVTFTKDVAPILFANCVGCHRGGEVAPFVLTTYKDARKHASELADVVETRYMPPWKPEAGHGDFMGERRLSESQIKTIRAWVDAGSPEGDPAVLPPLPVFTEGWALGEPDLVVKMPETYTVPAEGRDVFRCFVIPLNLQKDEYVTAVDFRPSNRKILHHALFFLDTSGQGRKLDAQDPGPGYSRAGGVGFAPSGGLGGWAPGVTPKYLPDGIARPLKKGSDFVLQIHFHPSGKLEQEQSSIGLYLAKSPPSKITTSFPKVSSRKINIAPGDKHFVVDDTFNVPLDMTLIGITPHAHLLCREIKVDATLPGGKEMPLVWIKDWNWDWQDQYLYKKAIQIPGGTKINLHYVYDNSTDNPKNPSSPPKRVTTGEQTTDEMAINFFQIVIDRESGLAGLLGGSPKGGPAAGNGRALGGGAAVIEQMLIKRFDKNGNGKLDPDEEKEARKTLGAEFGRSR